jgi:hypothetical protein
MQGSLDFNQNVPMKGNGQAMNSVSDSVLEMNVPARVKHWSPDGGAQVELMTRFGSLNIGSIVNVSLRPNPRGSVFDFAYYKKAAGLRTGGIVLLRKLKASGVAEVTAKSIDVLVPRNASCYVVQGAAVCILPPPLTSNTKMASEVIVAMIEEGIAISSIKDGAARIRSGLEQAAVFGKPGLVLTGEDKSGEVVEMVLGAELELTIDDIIYSFEQNTSPDVIATMKKSREKWRLVPFFRADVDPDMSKVSAQRLNFDYTGDDDIFSWTRSNCVLRAYGDEWIVVDTAVVSDIEDTEAGLIIDIIEG